MNRSRVWIWACGAVLLAALTAGCTSGRSGLWREHLGQVKVGEHTASEALKLMPERGLADTTSSVSVLSESSTGHEVGIVSFREADSLVQRKVYLHQYYDTVHQKMHLTVQTVVPEEVLGEPYENVMRENVAILRFCHQMVIEDVRPFTENQKIESLMGLARSALVIGILKVTQRPTEAYKLMEPEGFDFDHTSLDDCRLTLSQDSDDIYTVTVSSESLIDPFVKW